MRRLPDLCKNLFVRGRPMKKTFITVALLFACLLGLAGCVNPSREAFLTVEPSLCIGCGQCSKVCKFDAIVFIGNKAVIDPSKCQQCGRCVKVCPTDAIQ